MDACYNPLIIACYYYSVQSRVPHRHSHTNRTDRTRRSTLDGVLSLRFDD